MEKVSSALPVSGQIDSDFRLLKSRSMFSSLLLMSVLGMKPAKGSSKLVFMDAIGPDPTQPRKIPDPYSLHTGFNPSTSGFIQQHLEDCKLDFPPVHAAFILFSSLPFDI